VAGEVQWNVFTYIVDQVETPLITAVGQVVSAFLNFAAAPLQAGLVLYVALTGLMIIRGYHQEAAATLISRMIKIAIVVWFITGAGVYQQYVYDFFFTTIPNDLSNAITGTGGLGVVSANSFDTVWVKAWRAGLEVWKTLDTTDISEKFVVILFWLAGIISTGLCFVIWLVSRVLLALYIAVGPLLIALALFPATGSLFERWIGSMISCIVLQISTLVLLFIILQVETQVVASVVAQGTSDYMVMIQILLAGVIFFAVAAFIAMQLPQFASSLSGGLHFHTGAIARAAQSALGSRGRSYTDAGGNTTRQGRSGALGAAQTAGSFAARGVSAGGRAISRGIRPSPGGSLSDVR